jgi:ssDNA-binding Zn-finger/Zn-ribbon topoisomerase 1
MKCPKCKKVWNYKGKSEYYVTCPQCHKNVKIFKNLIKMELKRSETSP